MHTVLADLIEELDALSLALASLPNAQKALNLVYGNWSYPGVSAVELSDGVDRIVQFIKDRETDDIGEFEGGIDSFVERIAYLTKQTVPQIPNNGANHATTAIEITLQYLRNFLNVVLAGALQENADSNAKSLRDLAAQIRGMESRITTVRPKMDQVVEMVDKIESAYRAADELSVTEADLLQAKKDALRSAGEIAAHAGNLDSALTTANSNAVDIGKALNEATGLIAQLRDLHKIGTSTALAGAFHNRAQVLNRQVYYWLVALFVALAAAVCVGIERAHTISEALKQPDVRNSVIFIHSWLALLGFGAPVWLGWIATKQISQRFKLSEDYFFKASISNAYEGYRLQAVKIDEAFEKRLFESALDRLDEIPSRVIEHETYGSPAHEALKSGFWDFLIQVFGRRPSNGGAAEAPPDSGKSRPTKSDDAG